MTHETFLTFAAFTVGVTILWMRVSAMAEDYEHKIRNLELKRIDMSVQLDRQFLQIDKIMDALKVLNSRLK